MLLTLFGIDFLTEYLIFASLATIAITFGRYINALNEYKETGATEEPHFLSKISNIAFFLVEGAMFSFMIGWILVPVAILIVPPVLVVWGLFELILRIPRGLQKLSSVPRMIRVKLLSRFNNEIQ
jgi:hypothetical protein